MKYLLIIVEIMLLTSSCESRSGKSDVSVVNEENSLYTIDLDKVKKEESINMSDYFKEDVKVIILETNDTSLIGEISTLRVMGDYIIIKDDIRESVFVFNRDGTFLHKIGNKGHGPEEYSSVVDACVDVAKKEIYLYDFSEGKILSYHIESGDFIKSIKLKTEGVYNYYMHFVDNNMFISSIPIRQGEDDSFLLQKIDLDTGEPTGSFLSALTYNCGWNGLFLRDEGFFYPNNEGGAQYVQMFMNTLFTVNKDGLSAYLTIKKHNWITKEDIIAESHKEGGPLTSYLMSEKNISYNIHRFFQLGDIVYFQYMNNENERDSRVESVIFNAKTNKTRTTTQLKDDILYKGDQFIFPVFTYADDKGVYAYVPPRAFFYLLQIIEKEGLNVSPDIQQRIVQLAEDSNPIVFYYEYKQQ